MRGRRTGATARGGASAVAMVTGYLLQAKNDPPRIGTALAKPHRHCPVFAREGQFILDPFPFEKEALGLVGEKRLGETKQPLKRRASAGSHDIDRVRRGPPGSGREQTPTSPCQTAPPPPATA